MAKQKEVKIMAADFETTVYEGQTFTEVWASAVVELNSEDVSVFHSIDETFKFFKQQKTNLIVYYHNLKFDGSFWIDWLSKNNKFKVAIEPGSEEHPEFIKQSQMDNNTYRYTISDRGQWYQIIIRVNNFTIDIRDSVKLLPFSIKKIGKDFKTKHQKTSIEYTGFRYSGCKITDLEKEYIKNDVLVLKEALEIFYKEGHTQLTIGSCCMKEFKKLYTKKMYDALFPDLSLFQLSEENFTQDNADAFIRKSYKGGWCYLVKGKENKRFYNGITADVNSLYPSVMHSESGNRYPVGLPTFWKGNFIPEAAKQPNKYYFVRIKTRFYLKEGMLPFIQIKDSFIYKGTEALESSDYVDRKTGEHYIKYVGFNGEWKDTRAVLTLTCVDFELLKKHYNLVEFEVLSGCYFDTKIGIFDEYINTWRDIKVKSKGAQRSIAKLFLNNLYGKFGSNDVSSFKFAFVRPDKAIGFETFEEHNKAVGYIPIGSAVTSYARRFTITAAQENYHGKDKPGFIYADTDSIHCDLKPEELKGIKTHDTAFNRWKLESGWDLGYFVRQKTYIEHVVQEDLKDIEKHYYNIKCAGMPDNCKKVVERALEHDKDLEGLTPEQVDLVKRGMELEDFKEGFKVYGKLIPKRIEGGIVLKETTFELR